MLAYGFGSKLPLPEQMCLISANVVGPELFERLAEIAGEVIQNPQVVLNRDFGVIAALKFVQHHLA